MSYKVLLLHFLIGGTMVALVSYLGTHTRGILASFFATLPSITVITLILIYRDAGVAAATNYFRGMLLVVPAWIIYVLITMFLLPRVGLFASLAVSVTVYVMLGLAIVRIVD